MKARKILWLLIICLLSLLPACQSESGTVSTSPGSETTVPIRMFGVADGARYELDKQLIDEFVAETGIPVELVRGKESATDRLTEYQVFLSNESDDYDVYQIDVIWPGLLASHMIDLAPYLSEETEQHFSEIVQNNTVNGQLVGMPWYTDAGLLYYRTDLLEKYGYDGPPETWDELEEMAGTIQEGERANNPDFWGYVWQGNDYEGLTCDALEWQVSHGGGQIISPDGVVEVNNPETIAAFERAASWVGNISPPNVTIFQEEEARLTWQEGNAVFMRNWPYAYSLGQSDDSPIKGQFGVSLLPAGQGGQAATLGGWQLAVSKYSRQPEAAVQLVKFLTSPEIQKRRAIEGSYAPTIPVLYEDTEVIAANPYYNELADVFAGGAAARPSAITGPAYPEVSFNYFTAVHSILTGQDTAANALANLEDRLQDLVESETDTAMGPVNLEGLANRTD